MAAWPYSTATWRGLRTAKLRTAPLCEICKVEGRLKPATVVDHIVPIKHGGDAFPPLTGLQALCPSCHGRKTARGIEAGAIKAKWARGSCDAEGRPLDAAHPWKGGNGRLPGHMVERRMPSDLKPSAIPLTIVCGPTGAGKSTYVRGNAGPNDIVICLDTIIQQLTHLPEHHSQPWALPKAIDIRNTRLRRLASDATHEHAWFIVSAPHPSDRRKWKAALGGDIVVINTPLAECIRRIKADPCRNGLEDRMIDAATNWWKANPHLAGKSLKAGPIRTGGEVFNSISFGPGPRGDG